MGYNLADPHYKESFNASNYVLKESNDEYDVYIEITSKEEWVVPKDVFAFLFGDSKKNPKSQKYKTEAIELIQYYDYDLHEAVCWPARQTLLNMYVILAANKFTSVKFIAMDPLTEQVLCRYLQSSWLGFSAEGVSALEYTFDFEEFETKIEIVRGVFTSGEPVVPEYIFKYQTDLEELCFTDKLPDVNVPKDTYTYTGKLKTSSAGVKHDPPVVVPNIRPRGHVHIVSHEVTPDITLEDVIKGNVYGGSRTLYLTKSDLANSKGTALYFPLLKFIEQEGNTIFVSKEWTDFMVEFAKRSDRTITIVFE